MSKTEFTILIPYNLLLLLHYASEWETPPPNQVAQARYWEAKGDPSFTCQFPSPTISFSWVSLKYTSSSSFPLLLSHSNLSSFPLGIPLITFWVISLPLMSPPTHTVAGLIILHHKLDRVTPWFKINPWVVHHMLQWKSNFLHLPYKKNSFIFLGPGNLT